VKALYAFGSVINGKLTDQCDIDLLVEIHEHDSLKKGELLLSLWGQLEQHFKRKVDLLTYDTLSNPYLKECIDRTKKVIYKDGQNKPSFSLN
jgi:hypothetical protein